MYNFKVFHLVVRRNNKNVFPRAYLKAKTVGYRDHGGMSFNKPFNLDDTKKFQYSTVINILNLTVKLESCFQRLWWMKEWEKGWGRESERGYVSVYVRIVFFMFFITVSYRPCICFLCFQLHLLINWTGNLATCSSFSTQCFSFFQIYTLYSLHKWPPHFEICKCAISVLFCLCCGVLLSLMSFSVPGVVPSLPLLSCLWTVYNS